MSIPFEAIGMTCCRTRAIHNQAYRGFSSGDHDTARRSTPRLPVDIIVTDGGERVAEIAHEAAPTTPIVMAVAGNPIVAGLVASFAHPGGSLTGFSLLGTN